MRSLIPLSHGRRVPLFLFHLHWSSKLLFFRPSIPSLCRWSSDPYGESSLWPSSHLLNIYFCLYGWRQDCSLFSWQAPSNSPSCHFCLVFSFAPFRQAPPSIFLFFLNVIVKCSSEMTLNMCTLTEGIHLVIYFLLPVLCGLFIVSLSHGLIWLL